MTEQQQRLLLTTVDLLRRIAQESDNSAVQETYAQQAKAVEMVVQQLQADSGKPILHFVRPVAGDYKGQLGAGVALPDGGFDVWAWCPTELLPGAELRDVDDLTPIELDYWAARGLGISPCHYAPTQDWAQTGPLLVEHEMQVFNMLTYWTVQVTEQREGKTRVVAHADRATQQEAIVACFVKLKWGDKVPAFPR